MRRYNLAAPPLGSLVASGLNLAILTVAAAQGQFHEIAGYGAGAGATAIAAVLLGGGTTLVYASGSARERRAVRFARYRLIIPAMSLISVAIATTYALITPITFIPALAGGLFVVCTNASELPTSDLQRDGRALTVSTALILGRTIALLGVAASAPFSLAMLGGGGFHLLALAILTARSHERAREQFRLSEAFQKHLVVLALTDAIAIRLVPIVAPLMLSAVDTGKLTTLITAQQSAAAILTSSLYFVMNVESKHGQRPWMRRYRALIVWIGVFATLGAIAATPAVLSLLNIHDVPQWWWPIIVATTVPQIINRATQYRLIAVRRRTTAATISTCTAIGAISFVAALAALSESMLIGAVPLIGELCGLIYVALISRSASDDLDELHRSSARDEANKPSGTDPPENRPERRS